MISVRGARVHNLKNINVDIPKGKLTVITGLSGSGKSSIAFDTIYAEGQRRYMESLSSYARQFLEMQDKPDVDAIEGLSPTIAIDQKTASTNPRSTVGTVTEIYDSLRVLFARAGQAHCPECHVPVVEQTVEQMVDKLEKLIKQTDVFLMAPVVRAQKGEHKQALIAAEAAGFQAARYDGLLLDVDELVAMKKDKKKSHDIDIVIARYSEGQETTNEGLMVSVKQALDLGNGLLTVLRDDTGDDILMSQALMCPDCQRSLPSLQPNMFSFNSPNGACPECTGLGVKLVLEPELVIPNPRLTLAEGAVKPWSRIAGNSTSYLKILEAVGAVHKFDVNTPIQKMSQSKKRLILNGTGGEEFLIGGKNIVFPGVLGMLDQKYRETDSDYVRKELETYMRKMTCPECEGKRLSIESLAVTVSGLHLQDLVQMPLDELLTTFDKFGDAELNTQELTELEEKVIANVKLEVARRLENLINVGLGYLTLDRSAVSLSGGESQRVRLATQLGTDLSGVIYILDEPSIGLHQRDNDKLIDTMKRLRDIGNTVIVVEHDEAMMAAADHVIDVGPGAGVYGGEIIAAGTSQDLMKCEESLTGQYLKGEKEIKTPAKRRPAKKTKKLTIKGATAFNLKNVTVDIPLGQMVCVTGVSGSGKSTLILDILGKALAKHFYRAKAYPSEHAGITGIQNIDKVVTVDQSPIGRTPRSNPATYTGVFTAIRDLFANVPEAKMRGFDAGKFSFNVKGGGRCETCSGDGVQRIEMQFMPDVYVDCQDCQGKRYNAEALEVHYKQKTIADVLDMTVEEARRFFADTPAIYDKLNVLHEVGLGYIRLGQSATTLSGGEAQRVKLATELSRRSTGKTLYILDEPTTGLHFDDVKRLLDVLNQLVDKGNTVLMVEHNLDIVRSADHVIDMGPEGGIRGGQVVVKGTPEEVSKSGLGLTAEYLKVALKASSTSKKTSKTASKSKKKEAVAV